MYNGGFGAYPTDDMDMGVNSYFGESDTNFFGDTSDQSFFAEGSTMSFDSSDSFFNESYGTDTFGSDFFFESDSNIDHSKSKGISSSNEAWNGGSVNHSAAAQVRRDRAKEFGKQSEEAAKAGDSSKAQYFKNREKSERYDAAWQTRKAMRAKKREDDIDSYSDKNSK
jgi:hypothetical protein